jgi:hypothetical protein
MKAAGEAPVISEDHPLRRLFRELVWRRYVADRTLVDPEIADYVAGLLTDFVHVDRLYRLRDARGRRFEEVGEMLLQSNPLLGGRSFDAERELRKHVGDFTLFFAGLFPEWLDSLVRRRRVGIDAFIDYVRAGKESYAIVSEFNDFEYADEAPLFRRLSEHFELCVFGLNLVRGDLQRLHRETYLRISEELGPGGDSIN